MGHVCLLARENPPVSVYIVRDEKGKQNLDLRIGDYLSVFSSESTIEQKQTQEF